MYVCLCTPCTNGCMCVYVSMTAIHRTQPRGSFSSGQTDDHHWIHVISCLKPPDESLAGSKTHSADLSHTLCVHMCVGG